MDNQIKELIRCCQKPETERIVLNQDEFEEIEEKWYTHLKERYGEKDIRSVPVVNKELLDEGQTHFLVLGKAIIMECINGN